MRLATVEYKGTKRYFVQVGHVIFPVKVLHETIDGKDSFGGIINYEKGDLKVHVTTTGGTMKELEKNVVEALELSLEYNAEVNAKKKTPSLRH